MMPYVDYVEDGWKVMAIKMRSRLIEYVSIQTGNDIAIVLAFGGKGFHHWNIVYIQRHFAAALWMVKL